ncbi:MAG TPA: hydrogenase formation protein HypD [Gemmatales bacterium]|nr:hydrogenase formation protein HypD [Gemmatales bacterium]
MKYLDEYRDGLRAEQLMARIRSVVTRRWVLMEVCGGQTHSLLKHGIEAGLQDVIELVHGPGCPVCVTPVEVIDHAQELASQPGVTLCSFGDMLRVPGSESSLLQVRAQGGSVKLVYSPLEAVTFAQQHPDKQVVFFAVGFETTAPATALAVLQTHQRALKNFSLLVHHVRVQPAMEAIMQMPEVRVQAFLAAGHVCTVMGYDTYASFVERYRVPVVVTGFEPLDLLSGILECVKQLEAGTALVVNEYARIVRPEGNLTARQIVDQVYELTDQTWRGLGVISQSGYRLKPAWHQYDAARRFPFRQPSCDETQSVCHAGEVLSGRMRPTNCPSFGTRCTPESPWGAPMVSSEGACAAYYRYRLPIIN